MTYDHDIRLLRRVSLAFCILNWVAAAANAAFGNGFVVLGCVLWGGVSLVAWKDFKAHQRTRDRLYAEMEAQRRKWDADIRQLRVTEQEIFDVLKNIRRFEHRSDEFFKGWQSALDMVELDFREHYVRKTNAALPSEEIAG